MLKYFQKVKKYYRNTSEKLIWPRGGMVDTKDLKSLPYGSAGSSPAEATNFNLRNKVIL